MFRAVLVFIGILVLPFIAHTQPLHGEPLDSFSIRFDSITIPTYIADTATTPLWQVGHSRKSFFGIDSTNSRTIMTDSVNYYPINANNSFTIKIIGSAPIISFWHKFQTDRGHDGGIVEYSMDHGASWQNLKTVCDTTYPNIYLYCGIKTYDFYSISDTLSSGEPAFSGNENIMHYSRFQIFNDWCSADTGTCRVGADSFYVRFRFVSDTTPDTLAGWQIDSIKIENDRYEGIGKVAKHNSLAVFPDPSPTGVFTFPAMKNERQYTIEVYNAVSSRIYISQYNTRLDLSHYPKGVYFYRVSGENQYYTGQLLNE